MLIIQGAKDKKNIEAREQGILNTITDHKLLTLIIEPSSKCNLRCKFCDLHSGRNQNVDDYKGFMDIVTWKRLLTDIVSLKYKLKQLQFHGNGEPLLNKNIYRMIQEAKEWNIAESIRVTTNGILMTDISKLISAGADDIRVSLDIADADGYRKFKGRDFCDEVLANIFRAIPIVEESDAQLYIKYPIATERKDYGVDNNYAESVLNLLGGIADGKEKIHLIGMPVVVMTGGNKKFDTPCEIPFYSLFVKFDGRVTLCCADYSDELTIGNLKDESLGEIILGDKLFEKRMDHLHGNFEFMPICAVCENRTCVDLSDLADELEWLI